MGLSPQNTDQLSVFKIMCTKNAKYGNEPRPFDDKRYTKKPRKYRLQGHNHGMFKLLNGALPALQWVNNGCTPLLSHTASIIHRISPVNHLLILTGRRSTVTECDRIFYMPGKTRSVPSIVRNNCI